MSPLDASIPNAAPAVPPPSTRVPVWAAPMAGGPSTPELVAAVGDAGGLGFLAGGYLGAGELGERIGRARALTGAAIGVNVFVPAPAGDENGAGAPDSRADAVALDAYVDLLSVEAGRLGVELPRPRWGDDDDWYPKIALLTGPGRVEVVSFTFGTPPADVVDELHRVGTCVAVTVTTRAEAEAARACGADVLVVQGFEAGGHRGTHRVADTPNELDHLALLPLLADLGLPMVAAGAVTTGADTRRALAAGAVAVQAGTAFLLTDEAGTSMPHRMGLTDPSLTSTITRAFSGRCARGLRNRFVEQYDPYAPAVYPAVDQVTKPLRAAAARAGDLGGVSLWAGSGWRAAREGSAADVVRRLAGD